MCLGHVNACVCSHLFSGCPGWVRTHLSRGQLRTWSWVQACFLHLVSKSFYNPSPLAANQGSACGTGHLDYVLFCCGCPPTCSPRLVTFKCTGSSALGSCASHFLPSCTPLPHLTWAVPFLCEYICDACSTSLSCPHFKSLVSLMTRTSLWV